MKIMITGGSGYIGSNLTRYLMQVKSIPVVNIDKICYKLVEHIEYHDIKDITHIVHLAAIPGIKDCETNYNQATIDNIIAPLHLFELAQKNSIPVVFASSGSAQSPQDNYYATGKRICELDAIRRNVLDSRANFKILRFANIYGGYNYLGVKKSVVARFYKDDIPVVNGHGEQTRDFIHVDDIVKSIWLALNYKEVINKPMGIGTGINTSVVDLAEIFEKPYTFNINSEDTGVDESPSEVSLATELLGFKASIRLEDGIKQIIEK